jgi:Tol biopolymer transport system component
MTDDNIPVEPARERDWKQTVRQPKVWIPAAAVALVAVVVGGAAMAAGGGAPAASPSATSVASASPSPSASPSASPSVSASVSAEPSPSASASTEPGEALGLPYAFPGDVASEMEVAEEMPNAAFLPRSISPSGKYIAVVTPKTEACTVTLFDIASGDAAFSWTGDAYAEFSWLPGADKGVLASSERSGTAVYVVSPATNSKREIAFLSDYNPAAVSVAPDGRTAVVTLRNQLYPPRADIELYDMSLIAVDGSEVRSAGPGADAVYSPSGEHIFYRGYDGSGVTLWRMKADGTGAVRVGKGGAQVNKSLSSFGGPIVWSPDGKLGVYQQFADEYTSELRSVKSDGSGDTKLANAGNWADHTAFSPDGRSVLAVTNTTGPGEVTWIDIASGEVSRFKGELAGSAGGGGRINVAGWLPDGSAAVVSFQGVKAESWVFVLQAFATKPDLWAVEYGTGLSAPPVWAAAGEHVYWPWAETKAQDAQLVHAWLAE